MSIYSIMGGKIGIVCCFVCDPSLVPGMGNYVGKYD